MTQKKKKKERGKDSTGLCENRGARSPTLVMSPVPLPITDMDDTGKVWKNYPAFSPLLTFADVPLVDRRGHTTRTQQQQKVKFSLSLTYLN